MGEFDFFQRLRFHHKILQDQFHLEMGDDIVYPLFI